MSGYHVSFYKNLLSSDGHAFRCLQDDVFVENSFNPAQAVESACRQFERCHGLRNWKQLADSMEVESEARRVAQRQ